MMEGQLDHIADNEMKTIFEQVIDELRNIEYVLNYFIGISEKNKRKRFSRISSNESINLKSNLSKPTISPQCSYTELTLNSPASSQDALLVHSPATVGYDARQNALNKKFGASDMAFDKKKVSLQVISED